MTEQTSTMTTRAFKAGVAKHSKAFNAHAEKGDSILYGVATFTREAILAGLLRDGRNGGGMSPTDYLANFHNREGKPLSGSWLTMVKRLGLAAEIGVEDGSEVWKYLVQRVNTSEVVRDAVQAKGATVATITAAVNKDRAARDSKANGNKSARKTASEKGKGKGKTPVTLGDVAAALTDPETGKHIDAVALAVKILSARAKHLTPAQWADTSARLTRISNAVNALHAKESEQSEKVAS